MPQGGTQGQGGKQPQYLSTAWPKPGYQGPGGQGPEGQGPKPGGEQGPKPGEEHAPASPSSAETPRNPDPKRSTRGLAPRG